MPKFKGFVPDVKNIRHLRVSSIFKTHGRVDEYFRSNAGGMFEFTGDFGSLRLFGALVYKDVATSDLRCCVLRRRHRSVVISKECKDLSDKE
jgi:hypothetical protein